MAHPDRDDMAYNLRDKTGGTLVWDDSNNQLDTCDRAWGLHDHDADWSVVLEDDAVPIDLFEFSLVEALERSRNLHNQCVISLYVGSTRPIPRRVSQAVKKADSLGAGWLRYPSLLWNVGVAMPTYLVPKMLEFVKDFHIPADERIGRWAREYGIPVLYTWPAIVDHADKPSLIKRRRVTPRVAIKSGRQFNSDHCVDI